MFSSVDHRGNRTVLVSVTTDEGTAPAVIPEEIVPALERQSSLPDRDALRESAEELAEMEWSFRGDGHLISGRGAPALRVQARLVNISVKGPDVVVRTITEAEATP